MKKTIAILLTTMLVVSFSLSAATAFTPPGLAKKGWLPPGIQKRFIQRIEQNYSYETTIKAIDLSKSRIMIQEGTAEINLLVAKDAKIELNGSKSTLNNLEVGDKVIIKTDTSNTITELKATGGNRTVPPKQTQVKGTIQSIDLGKKEIILQEETTTKLYRMSNTVVYIDNQKKALADLKTGMEITAHVEGLEIKTLYAKSTVITELKATIKSINTTRREIVLQHGNKEELYKVNANAVIKINGATQPLSSLKVDTMVDVKIQNGEIIEIITNGGIYQLEGRLIAKNTGQQPTITVEINGTLIDYNVSKEFDISHINVGKQIILYIKDNLVVAIQEKN